ncbi:SpoIIE family protein phosphatase [Arenibaculum sp.]|uniref:SpoIIE family protein phosphatase n=1 Tax=Arenibaculum sp. TaxID=2865862 RepID=UPI002E0D896A|nr:SpoIIE family protein phosphatase [Arenibaculum sp.]
MASAGSEAAGIAIPGAAPRRVRAGLTVRQAGITLAVALTLGLLAGAIGLVSDWYAAREEVRRTVAQSFAMVSESAAEAAFQMNPTLGERVVAGLLEQPTVRKVVLTDDFGGLLGERERAGGAAAPAWLAERLFGDIAHHSIRLVQHDPAGTGDAAGTVGVIEVWLDERGLAEDFLRRAGRAAVAETLRAAGICAVMVLVFYLMITRPLLGIATAVTRVDPARPAERPVPVPARHRTDELGLLVGTLNDLLRAFGRGLAERDRAEKELTALARDLEHRVADRTRALETAHDDLAREKEEVERALAGLNRASRYIDESIRYARRIQTSLLPRPGALGPTVHEVAVGWHPRDSVGGDYYWLDHRDGLGLAIVVDCTGHGVPGAFMTAIVASVLGRVLSECDWSDPAAMLSALDLAVRGSLRQDAGSDDGLDAAVCVVDSGRRIVSYAGANIPLYVSAGGSVSRVRGDRRGLGHRSDAPGFAFRRHDVALEPGMAFFLCTDGIVDQVGGAGRRSFGYRRLQQALAASEGLAMDDRMTRVFADFDAYRSEEAVRDDVTFIGLLPLPPPPPQPGSAEPA